MQDQTVMGAYFEQETRRRDDKIRGLGVEIDSLEKNASLKKSEIAALEASIEKSKSILDSLDEQILSKNSAFEVSKSNSLLALKAREYDLNKTKESHDARDKEIQSKWAEVSQSLNELSLHKKEIIDSLKSASDEIVNILKETSETIESI